MTKSFERKKCECQKMYEVLRFFPIFSWIDIKFKKKNNIQIVDFVQDRHLICISTHKRVDLKLKIKTNLFFFSLDT